MRISDWSSDVCSSDLDLLGERAETHAARRQLADFLDQVAHRTPKTIEFTDHQRVAGTQIGERLGQAGPIGFCYRGIIDEYAIATGSAQSVEREGQILGCGREGRKADESHMLPDRVRVSNQLGDGAKERKGGGGGKCGG